MHGLRVCPGFAHRHDAPAQGRPLLSATVFAQPHPTRSSPSLDDLVVLEQISNAELERARNEGVRTWGAGRTAHARKVYDEVGLETNPNKAFEDAVL